MYSQSRAGLYIQKSTRSRLNLFKAQYALLSGQFVNQSEAIDALLDLAGIARCGAFGASGASGSPSDALSGAAPDVHPGAHCGPLPASLPAPLRGALPAPLADRTADAQHREHRSERPAA